MEQFSDAGLGQLQSLCKLPHSPRSCYSPAHSPSAPRPVRTGGACFLLSTGSGPSAPSSPSGSASSSRPSRPPPAGRQGSSPPFPDDSPLAPTPHLLRQLRWQDRRPPPLPPARGTCPARLGSARLPRRAAGPGSVRPPSSGAGGEMGCGGGGGLRPGRCRRRPPAGEEGAAVVQGCAIGPRAIERPRWLADTSALQRKVGAQGNEESRSGGLETQTRSKVSCAEGNGATAPRGARRVALWLRVVPALWLRVVPALLG